MFSAKKQPDERLDYDVDFTDWFEDAPGDEIENFSADDVDISLVSGSEGGGSTLAVDAVNTVGDPALIAKVWLSGGVHGCTYKVTVTIDTEEGRRKQVEFKVAVKET